MDIIYVNTKEDIEFMIKFIQYKFGINIFKYLGSIFSFVSGIYYSIKLNNIIYFFTNSIILAVISYLILRNVIDKEVEKYSKKNSIKLCKKDKYYLSEKKLLLESKSIFVYWDENNLEIKLDPSVKLYKVDKYILILPMSSFGYKKQLIIPNKSFKNEEEIQRFIEEIREKINIKTF